MQDIECLIGNSLKQINFLDTILMHPYLAGFNNIFIQKVLLNGRYELGSTIFDSKFFF